MIDPAPRVGQKVRVCCVFPQPNGGIETRTFESTIVAIDHDDLKICIADPFPEWVTIDAWLEWDDDQSFSDDDKEFLKALHIGGE